MKRLLFLVALASVSGFAAGMDVEVDFSGKKSPMLPLHGVCNSPLLTRGVQTTFKDAGIPFMRPHDACGAFGGAHYIDIPNLFPDFSKDENDPASYDFKLTDAYLGTVVAAGTEVFYRLGVTFEPQTKFIKPYNVIPPPDFAKWARICEHVIRHYTEGWADGRRWNIRYWEIWNEPETSSGWMGSHGDFLEFYRIASNHLKAKFPHLKIGGYAASGFYAAIPGGKVTPGRRGYLDFFTNFIAYAQAPATKCVLDFFSWHIYTLDPEEVAAQARWCRGYLDSHGLAGVETVMNEWNRIDHLDTAGRVRYYDEMKESPGASFAAAVFCLLQRDRTVSKAMYYDAYPQRAYCGLYYFPSQRTTPCWEAFRKFNVLYRLGSAVPCRSNVPGVYVCAATDGNRRAILLANTGAARTVSVSGVGNVDMEAGAVELIEIPPSPRRAVAQRARAGAAKERRLAWTRMEVHGGKTPDWDAVAARAKRDGITDLMPLLSWNGSAYFPSAVTGYRKELVEEHGDQLEKCLAACQRHGVKCHVRKVNWRIYGSKEMLERMRAEKRLQRIVPKGAAKGAPLEDSEWLCPGDPRNRRLEVDAMVELASKGVDGIQFDYIRYDGYTGCYCDGCRARFEARIGRKVANWPADVGSRIAPLVKEWDAYRRETISAVVEEVSRRVRRDFPKVEISAAVQKYRPGTAPNAQDWTRWCRERWVDFVCPMDYTEQDDRLRELAGPQKTVMDETGVPVYPGIGVYSSHSRLDATAAARQIELLRSMGFPGHAIFSFRADTYPEFELLAAP